ncbi:hypothetical protein ES703_09113 [subsurface metagenome]
MEKLDIILLTHNNLMATTRCIDALYKNTGIKFQLTVIDDSTDLTPAYFKRLAKEKGNINYVRPEEKIVSGNQPINIGLKLTKSDPVAYLICSAFVEPDWLGISITPQGDAPFAIRLFEKDSRVGMVGFKIISPETNTIIEAGDHVLLDTRAINIGRGEPSHHHVRVIGVNAIAFCAILMRRAAIPKGGWDESTYIGFRGVEDIDNCLTIRKAGWRILYNGFGSVYHEPHGSDPKYANEKVKDEMLENHRRFSNKWFGKIPLAGDA